MSEIFHPVAGIWPLLPEAELEALAEDIRENGLRYPVWRHRDGRIIDGRNRWLACRKAGVECPSETYVGPDGADLVKFALSLNEMRRHLDTSQRALVAARIANLDHGQKKADTENSVSQSEAAGLLNVSVDSVQFAKKVVDCGVPELVAAVEHCEVKVSTAAAVATLPTDEQHEIVARGEAEILRVAREIRTRKRLAYSGEYEWYTPAEYVEAARSVMGGIDLDPASSDIAQRTVRAATYYTEDNDGLAQPWRKRVWLNPPYARDAIDRFVRKLLDEHAAGNVPEAVLLVDNRTDTDWWQEASGQASALCFTDGRIQFTRPDGTGGSPTNGSIFLYFGDNPAGFAATFRAFGRTLYGYEVAEPEEQAA
jgi:phage N-6-adenine-methyltransferase